jgi:alkylation response protein AidB-like acyl-CoA dehydrogenase
MIAAQEDGDRYFTGVVEGLKKVESDAARRADEIDELRSIPPDLFDDLVATGFFQSLFPKAYGGYELSLSQVNEMLIGGARANPSLGWVMMIGGHGGPLLGMLPMESVTKLLDGRPAPRLRGAVAPKGVAVPVEGGYVVSGQWPFASGGPAPDLVLANCLVIEGGAPRFNPAGVPETVVVFVPASDVEFLDTWQVLGLRGTDSCDFAMKEVFVPEDMTANIFTSTNCFDTAPLRLPIRVYLATGHASFAIGVAEGALEEIAELAKTKHAAMNPSMRLADDPVFRHIIGENSLRLASVRALLDRTTETAWEAGVSGRKLSPAETLVGRTMAGYITAECVKIVDAAYTLAGSVSLYDASSLQRRLRDIHVATQHVAATGEGYRTVGALLVGDEMTPMDLF